MANEVDFFITLSVPKINGENEEGCIDVTSVPTSALMNSMADARAGGSLDVYLGIRRACILNNQSDTWRWCYWSSVLE